MNIPYVFDIKRSSLSDGDGMRTVIFFKGCNLDCFWCHNPEGKSAAPQLAFFADKCTGCGVCRRVCLSPDNCKGCFSCTETCHSSALRGYGKKYTAEDLLNIVLADKLFYAATGGGVTFSGGECMLYADFLASTAKLCHNKGINVAIDTAGCVPFSEIEKVVNILDEILHNCLVSEIEETMRLKINDEEIMDFILYREDLVNAIVQAFQEMATDKYHITGQSNILRQPEFQDIEKVKDLFDAIEKKEILKVVKYDETGISVRIGSENEIRALQDCTVITVPYSTQSGEKGAISIFGPTRMEYSKIIPLLEYISKNINKIL